MIAHHEPLAKSQELSGAVEQLDAYVRQAAIDGKPAHEVEQAIFDRVLGIGRIAMGQFFDLQGDGDLGQTCMLPDGRAVTRLEGLHARPFVTVFGEFELQRVVYGKGEHDKIEFIPLDTRLQLPLSKFSYLLQDWDQMLATEGPYNKVNTTLERILGLRQHVDSLERMSRQMAPDAEAFCWSQQAPPKDEEGEILVETADGKGVPIRRANKTAPIQNHQHKPGPKPDRKKMATVGSVYTVDRYVRTPEDVLQALFQDGEQDGRGHQRPRPCHKRVYARLNEKLPEGNVHGASAVFGWISQEVNHRNLQGTKETICIMDGQPSLWDMKAVFQPNSSAVEILDLLHVTPRLWKAAHLFHKPDSSAAEAFVRDRVLRILRGEVVSVVRGLRRMATLRGLSPGRRKKLNTICGYFENNQQRMNYADYLARGYPIASGVIEGACRHVVKDRLERTGMSWTTGGAQAILLLRGVYISGQWDEFIDYHINQETQRLYPYRKLVEQVTWPMAA